ncbi:hypothetical protein D9611_000073 [Ephemerocybe angulata]|uniref:SAM domain-containing protein n=1 Tax=Ephemerocybe angulata TaxID=980116 RepID=A0A8H5BLV0_9AGAR|nr:hypothetical protein D9611_000073 [Tulosesus angulatus]
MSNIESTTPASATPEVVPAAASGQAATPAPTTSGFEEWIKGFEKYESMLGDVAKISLNPKYKEELGTVEQWYKVLTPSERTATVYHLIQTSTQDQLRFFGSTIQRLARLEDTPAPGSATIDGSKPKLAKLSMRPPSLNLPSLGSPETPTPLTAKESAAGDQSKPLNLEDPSTWTNSTNAGNTPLLPLFQKPEAAAEPGSTTAPGLSMMNPYTLNMLANAGLSPEAQLLAVQLIMSGLVQPTGAPGAAAPKAIKKTGVPGTATWRGTPSSARFPGSALRTGLRPSALKSAGLGALKSASLESPSVDSPKPEDFKPEMLEDIPGWFRSLRLHKYTPCFEGLTWQELISLDDAGLEGKGVSALGARRRLLRTFEHARKTMGLEEPSSATPTSTINTNLPKLPEVNTPAVPHSAVPATRSKLSITSPIFTPTWETGSNGPASAAPSLSVPSPALPVTESSETKA